MGEVGAGQVDARGGVGVLQVDRRDLVAVLLRTISVSDRPYADAVAASEVAHNVLAESPVTEGSAPQIQGVEPSLVEPMDNRWSALVKE
ncbi:hypothetical protein ACT4S5_01685 [Kocuria oceani]|uniref:hypothetical protein n=1 Tax=Kocuria oceani TaxID=988827 RepID=UPI00403701BE